PRRSSGEGPLGALSHLAAGDLAAPRRAQGCRPREGSARRALHLLPGGAARDEAAHRLDSSLPRLLDRARRSPRPTTGEHGPMTRGEKTPARETESIGSEFELRRPPHKVWRALTDPVLLAQWLLPALDLHLEPGAAFRFQAPPQPGWDGTVNCRLLEID